MHALDHVIKYIILLGEEIIKKSHAFLDLYNCTYKVVRLLVYIRTKKDTKDQEEQPEWALAVWILNKYLC